MFRVWGKIFKDNHMLADTTICDGGDDSRTHKIFHALMRSVISLILASRSGWNPTSGNLSAMRRPVSGRTVLWMK